MVVAHKLRNGGLHGVAMAITNNNTATNILILIWYQKCWTHHETMLWGVQGWVVTAGAMTLIV